jgi:nicotinate (nicotinamide) nucleotide adenylyltransferase
VRLGVFGGSFDPIHIGHLAVAEEARARLGLDRVLFVPARLPPHKPDAVLAPAEDRLAMVRAAIGDHPGFAVSDLELRRAGPSYTVDTLQALRAAEPAAELFCLVGSDSAVELHTWRDPPRLYALATFVVLLRPGWPAERLQAWLEAQPPQARPRLLPLEVPQFGVASREVRRRVRAGETIRYLVPEPVRLLIERRGLYRDGLAAAPGAPPPTPDEVRQALRAQLSPPRAAHCERVAETAVRLARRHGLDPAAAELAGLLHDWYREVPAEEIIRLARSCGVLPADAEPEQVVPAALHGPVAARLLPQRWPGLPEQVLTAIDRHTTGDPQMTAFDLLLYVADLAEPGHAFPGVEQLRALAERDLAAAALAAMEATLEHLLRQGRAIDRRTVAARNALLARVRGQDPAGAAR